jgi:hypothetical protein
MKRRSARVSLLAAVLAVGVVLACSSPEGELRKAKAAGTAEALDAFLARHPDGPLAEQAKDAKEQLAFDGAKAAGTVAAYENFLTRYPGGKLAPVARTAVEELHFSEAQGRKTIEAYERFLHQHPEGARAEQAGLALDGLLPSGGYANVGVATTVSENCSASFPVTLLHKMGALGTEAPAVTPGTMDCAGTIGPTAIEIERVDRPHPNHTVLRLKSTSTAGWGGCRATCTIRFSVLGQEHAAMAFFR